MPLLASTARTTVLSETEVSDLYRRSAERHRMANLIFSGTLWSAGAQPAVFALGEPTLGRLPEEECTALLALNERVSDALLAPSDQWTQRPETAIPAGILAAFELSDAERERLIRSVVSSEALEDVHLSSALVSRLLDKVLLEPPIKLG